MAKLNPSSREYFEKLAFNQKQTIRDIEEYANACFHKGDEEAKNKVFYHYYEWCGWRFYLKAIRHRDWKSIIGKLKDHLGLR